MLTHDFGKRVQGILGQALPALLFMMLRYGALHYVERFTFRPYIYPSQHFYAPFLGFWLPNISILGKAWIAKKLPDRIRLILLLGDTIPWHRLEGVRGHSIYSLFIVIFFIYLFILQ